MHKDLPIRRYIIAGGDDGEKKLQKRATTKARQKRRQKFQKRNEIPFRLKSKNPLNSSKYVFIYIDIYTHAYVRVQITHTLVQTLITNNNSKK